MDMIYKTRNHVGFLRGDAPLVLSAPHDGDGLGPSPHTLIRRGNSRDIHCRDLVQEVAQAFAEVSGQWPYVVFAQAHRVYADANRDRTEGYHPDNPRAQRAWETYHEQLRLFIQDIHQRFPGQGLLLDLHGANLRKRLRARFPQADPAPLHGLFLGSLKGSGMRSIARLQAERGKGVLYDPGGLRPRLHGMLLSSEATPSPLYVWPRSEQDAEPLRGRYILQTYGSHQPDGINALQLEHSRELRDDETLRQQYAHLLAQAVWDFLQEMA